MIEPIVDGPVGSLVMAIDGATEPIPAGCWGYRSKCSNEVCAFEKPAH